MTVPIGTVKRLLLVSAVGYVVFTLGVVATAVWWQGRTSDRIDHAQEQNLRALEVGLLGACDRGNTIRRQLAEDNREAIRTTRELLSGPGLSTSQRAAYEEALTRRLTRQGELVEYPCGRLSFPPDTR